MQLISCSLNFLFPQRTGDQLNNYLGFTNNYGNTWAINRMVIIAGVARVGKLLNKANSKSLKTEEHSAATLTLSSTTPLL